MSGRTRATAGHVARLDNGLRVVVDPESTVPSVCVAVVYGAGTRSERRDQVGLAHLVEHLMFQGSTGVGPGEHARLVERTGGVFNAVTRSDDTVYHQVVPPGALRQVLFCEADRMRGLRVTEQHLRREIEVIAGEFQSTVNNVPYGAFPRSALKALLFDRFANTHHGYEDMARLAETTVGDVERFLHDHYVPGNAVVAVAGQVDPEEALTLTDAYFGDIPAATSAPRIDAAEPEPARSRHGEQHDPLAPFPAVAAAWRVPDPIHDLEAFLPYVVLAELLVGGRAPLSQRLVHDDGVAVAVDAAANLVGDPFGVRDPTGFCVAAYLRPGTDAARVLAAVDREFHSVADVGPGPDELVRARGRLTARLAGRLDEVSARAVWAARFALQRNEPTFGGKLLRRLSSVDEDDVRAAAASLRSRPRATVELTTEATAWTA